MLTYSPLVTTDFPGTGSLTRSYFEDLEKPLRKESLCFEMPGGSLHHPGGRDPPGTISSRIADQGSIQYFAQNWENPDSAPRVVWKRGAMMFALFNW
jgi:hypothetical protein